MLNQCYLAGKRLPPESGKGQQPFLSPPYTLTLFVPTSRKAAREIP